MANFFKPNKDDGTVLHLTKSGKWEKCTIPVGCTRHIDPKSFKDGFKVVKDFDEWSEEAHNARSNVLSVDDYNGWEPEEDDPFDDMKMNVNPSSVEMNQKRKAVKEQYGVSEFISMTDFNAEHEACKSYQTACADCAEKHEMKLYELFSREELGNIVREDSMFYNPDRKLILATTDVNGEEVKFLSHEFRGVLSDLPQWQQWQYLPNKPARQLELEREGVNYGNHIGDDKICRVCSQQVYDVYCMDCWVPSGYLLQD